MIGQYKFKKYADPAIEYRLHGSFKLEKTESLKGILSFLCMKSWDFIEIWVSFECMIGLF